MNIKHLIERSGKTQTEIAQALGVHQTLVSVARKVQYKKDRRSGLEGKAMNKLKEARERSGLTQRQVAEAVGIAERAYQRYERDTTPLAPVACKIAKVLGVTVESLYGES